MSLIDPTPLERFAELPKNVKMILGCFAMIILIGVVLFGIDKCDTYRSNHDVNKLRANVNAALAEVNAAQANVANDNVAVAVAVEKVKAATNAVVDATNATEAARTQTNAALANLANAANANRPVGTTGEDLKRQLDQLGVQ